MSIEIPPDEVELRFSRSSGPGGQNVNTRATRVEVLFDPAASRALTDEQKAIVATRLAERLDASGRLRVVASAARTQAANRAAALERLSGLIERALRPPPPPRRKTKPSRASVERRVSEKKARGAVKRLRGRADEE